MVLHWFRAQGRPQLEAVGDHQHRRRDDHGRRLLGHRHHQVHGGWLDRRGDRADHGGVLRLGEAALRHGPSRTRPARRRTRRPQLAGVQPSAQPRDRAGQGHRPPPGPGTAVRQDAARRLDRGALHRRLGRRRRGVPRSLGQGRDGHPTERRGIPVPRGDRTARRLRARRPASQQGPRRHRDPAGVRAHQRRRRDAARPDVVLDQAAALRSERASSSPTSRITRTSTTSPNRSSSPSASHRARRWRPLHGSRRHRPPRRWRPCPRPAPCRPRRRALRRR